MNTKKEKHESLRQVHGTTARPLLVTQSSRSVSAVCGRLAYMRTLPIYIVFSSGNCSRPHGIRMGSAHFSECIFDKEGKGLPWRYSSKRSVNEGFSKLYIEEILCPTLGYHKPRDADLGKQGVIICVGMGTHLA